MSKRSSHSRRTSILTAGDIMAKMFPEPSAFEPYAMMAADEAINAVMDKI
jgi:hypothetical protein